MVFNYLFLLYLDLMVKVHAKQNKLSCAPAHAVVVERYSRLNAQPIAEKSLAVAKLYGIVNTLLSTIEWHTIVDICAVAAVVREQVIAQI